MIEWEEQGEEVCGRGPAGKKFKLIPVFTAHTQLWEAYVTCSAFAHVRLCHRATQLEAERACLRHLAQRQLDAKTEQEWATASAIASSALEPAPVSAAAAPRRWWGGRGR